MRFLRVFLIGLGGIFVLGGATLLWLFNSDMGRFQPQLQTYLGERLDRHVRLESLSLKLGWPIHISGTGLSIANAPWAGDAPMLQIERLEAVVDFWSLFDRGPVIVDRLKASEIKLRLAWDKEGQGNFRFNAEETDQANVDQKDARVLLRDVSVTSSDLSLDYPDHSNHFTVQNLALGEQADGMLKVDVAGTVNEQPLSFSGQLGTFDGLLTASNVRFEGAGQFAGLTFNGSAEIEELEAPNRPVLDLEVNGPNLADVETLLGLQSRVTGAFSVQLKSSISSDKRWQFDLDGKAGEVNVQINGHAGGLRDLSTVAASVTANGPNLDAVVSLFGITQMPEAAFKLSGSVLRDGPALSLDDIQLSVGQTNLALEGSMNHFPHLDGGELRLHADGPDIAAFRELFRLPGIAEGPFKLSAILMPKTGGAGDLEVRLDSSLGELNIDGRLSSDPNYVGSTLQIELQGDNAAAVLEQFAIPGIEAVPFTVDTRAVIGEGLVEIQDGAVTGLYAGELSVDGTVGYDFFSDKTRLNLRLEGADLASSLSTLAQIAPVRNMPFTMATQLRTAPGEILLNDLEVSVAASRLSADARIPVTGDGEGLKLTFRGEGPDLGALLSGQPELEKWPLDVPAASWTLAGQLEHVSGRMALRDISLRAADFSLDANAESPWPPDVDEFKFSLRSSANDLRAILPKIGDFKPASTAYKLKLEGWREASSWHFKPSSLEFAGAQLDMNGTVDLLKNLTETDFSLLINIPDLQQLGSWNDAPLPATSAGLKAELRGTQNTLSLQEMLLTLGESSVRGQLSFDPGTERPEIALQLDSDGLDLREILPAKALSTGTAGAPSSPSIMRNNRLIPDTPIDFMLLKRFDGEANINLNSVITHRRIVDNVAISASLNDGALTVHDYRSSGLSGELAFSGTVDVLDTGGAQIEITMRISDFVPKREDWKDADPATLPRFNGSLKGSGSGASLHELAGSLNGTADLMASEGVFPGNGLAALNDYLLTQLLSIIAPDYSSRQPTRLLCMAASVDVVNGLVSTKPLLVLRTDKMLLESTGTVDLDSENIRLSFQTTPTKLLGTSLTEFINPFVSIRGTLAKPNPVIDPAGTLIYGGAAAATGGLSLIAKGLWNRLEGSTKPCEHLRDALQAELAGTQKKNSVQPRG